MASDHRMRPTFTTPSCQKLTQFNLGGRRRRSPALVGPYSIAGRDQTYFCAVVRSHLIARDQIAQIAGVFALMKFRSRSKCTDLQCFVISIPASRVNHKPTPVLDISGRMTGFKFRLRTASQKTNLRSIAYPFAENRDPIAATGLLSALLLESPRKSWDFLMSMSVYPVYGKP